MTTCDGATCGSAGPRQWGRWCCRGRSPAIAASGVGRRLKQPARRGRWPQSSSHARCYDMSGCRVRLVSPSPAPRHRQQALRLQCRILRPALTRQPTFPPPFAITVAPHTTTRHGPRECCRGPECHVVVSSPAAGRFFLGGGAAPAGTTSLPLQCSAKWQPRPHARSGTIMGRRRVDHAVWPPA